MAQHIRIKELREPFWKRMAALSICLAVVLFIIFWNMSDAFWAGIVRFASFISFTSAVLCGLKAIEGSLDIEVRVTDNILLLTFLKKGKLIREESHELSDIEFISSVPSSAPLSLRQGSDFIIRFKDSGQNFDLFHFGGRTLKIDREDADQLIHLFNEHNIPFTNSREKSIP